MRKIFVAFAVLAGLSIAGCKRELPENPTIVSPINSLILTVNGTDYIAKPSYAKGTQ